MNRQWIHFAGLICAASIAVSCRGSRSVGEPAPADTPAVPLAAILESPETYDGRTVVLRGTLTGQCASLCDFTYTEGGRSVTVFMGNVKAPRIPTGRPVRVTAVVHQGERQVVFTAAGLEVLRPGERP